jgi:hypothetical protein
MGIAGIYLGHLLALTMKSKMARTLESKRGALPLEQLDVNCLSHASHAPCDGLSARFLQRFRLATVGTVALEARREMSCGCVPLYQPLLCESSTPCDPLQNRLVGRRQIWLLLKLAQPQRCPLVLQCGVCRPGCLVTGKHSLENASGDETCSPRHHPPGVAARQRVCASG